MTTSSLQPIFEEWESLVQSRKNILGNKNLSPIGIKGELEKLETRRAGLLGRALETFTREYERQARAMEANGKARGKALESALARFGNLQYAADLEAERVSGLLQSGKSFVELLIDFRDRKDSGTLVLGWARALANHPVRSEELQQIRTEVALEVEQLKNTSDVQRINERGRELADAALALRDDTIRMMSLISRSGGDPTIAAQLQNLMLRIKTTPLSNGMLHVEFTKSRDEELQSQSETLVFGG
jgi:hypothetical protein